jgi:hypothetical protein
LAHRLYGDKVKTNNKMDNRGQVHQRIISDVQLQEYSAVYVKLAKLIDETLTNVNYKEVLILKDICDFEYREIAQTLVIPMGTVMSRLFRARRILQKKIKEDPTFRPMLQELLPSQLEQPRHERCLEDIV